MSVACVASYKRALVYRVLRGNALADCKRPVSNRIPGTRELQDPRPLTDVDRPPIDPRTLRVDTIRPNNLPHLLEQFVRTRPILVHAARGRVDEVVILGLLDIEPDNVVLAWNNEDRPRLGVDERLAADVGVVRRRPRD